MPFDLIDPLDGLIGRMAKGPMHRIVVGQSSFTGHDIENILRRYGIRTWGREPSATDDMAFLVRSRQAAWAEYLLKRAGVPVLSSISESDAPLRHGGTMPAPGSKHGTNARTFVDIVVASLAGGSKGWIENATFAPKKPKSQKKAKKRGRAKQSRAQKFARWFWD